MAPCSVAVVICQGTRVARPDWVRSERPPPPKSSAKFRRRSVRVPSRVASGVAVQAKVGDPVFQGDVIETAANGRVSIRFIDGTTFNLSSGARMVLNEFVCDPSGALHSALFSVVRGTFAFIAGQVAKAGGLRIDTPFASLRGRAPAGGIGVLSLAALTFSIIEKIQAAPSDYSDDDAIKYKDLGDFGLLEIRHQGT